MQINIEMKIRSNALSYLYSDFLSKSSSIIRSTPLHIINNINAAEILIIGRLISPGDIYLL
jgi:hypothetical protein